MHSADEPTRSIDRHTTVGGDRIDDDDQSPGDEYRHLLADDSAELRAPDSTSTTAIRKRQRSRQDRRRKRGRDSMESVEDKNFDSIIQTVPEDQQFSTKKSTRYRWIVIFILSISGDGWSYEASVMSSVLNMPQFIARGSYTIQFLDLTLIPRIDMGYGDDGVLPYTANILIGPIYS